jgi:uncharacterized protein YndB with AHSA1/START domain
VSRTIQIAPVRKAVTVDATPAEAFAFFTGKVDRWWPKDHHIGKSPVIESVIEPFVGGRWYSRHEDGAEAVVGHVRVWEPGARFVVGWEINGEWKPEPRVNLSSEVEVRFIADGVRTRVELEHRNFERMESGGQAMRDGVDQGWPGILQTYATMCSQGALQP